MYLASFETSNFLFEGVGETEEKSLKALRTAIHEHCKRTGAVAKEFFYPDEVHVREIQAGWAFIDKEKI